ncbi:HNH endonuclease [Arthrobacter sp. L77]|uniref:HNH endonuclease n=1 Tax=Arthrobacter sp. L77 TaxID=1496689 RepID=UPI00068D453F|nr:HNH endonuclease [Arthrobacter sp. L77]
MAAVIIPWNPAEPQWDGPYGADVDAVRRDGLVRQRWTLPAHLSSSHAAASHGHASHAAGSRFAGRRFAASRGMDVWLVILAGPPAAQGLIGHGSLAVVGSPTPEDEPTTSVEIDFDALLAYGDQLALPRLVDRVPGVLAADGRPVVIEGTDEDAMRAVWREAFTPDAGSLEPAPGSLPPAAGKRVQANRFERDPEVRRTVVAHRGAACHACGLDFEQRYGLDGGDLIQMHHITPPEYVDADYAVDPLVDLVPLCPSCHVVAHSRWPRPYGVGELRGMLARSGFLRGSALTEEQLAAEAGAARILDASSGPDAP